MTDIKITRRTALVASASAAAYAALPPLRAEPIEEPTPEELKKRPGAIIYANQDMLWIYLAWLCRERATVALATSSSMPPYSGSPHVEVDDLAFCLPPPGLDLVARARAHLEIDGLADLRPKDLGAKYWRGGT